ncbi:MAG: TonB-dependent receptor [Brevundimonas sp.]|nr:MAG: TonB-dependent receptor [Brevundimonas sp.]
MAALGAALPADASPDRRLSLRIPSQRVDRALLDMAVQARVSLGGDLSSCRGVTVAVNGTMTLDSALTRLLAGSGCTHTVSGAGVVIIRRAERPRPPVASRPAPTPPVIPAAVEFNLDEAYELSDVIVTAERRPDSPQTAAVAVTAVSGEQISAAGGADAHDLSNLIAGMTVTNLGSGRNKILLRGMSDGAFTGLTQSTVGLYLDLVPITYSAPDPDLKLIDIDRVEVLRGPQGALYGTGPIGGVVRIMTRRPDPLAPSLDLFSTRSVTDGGGANTDYSATFNLPLPDERGAIRGVAYEEAFDGYIDDLSLSLRRVNASSRRGGRLTATARFGPDWSATTGVVHQSIDTEDTHYVYRTLGGLRRANLVREPHANDFTEVYANIEGRGDWGRIDGSLAHIDHRFRSRFDASTALRLFGSTGRIGALDESKTINVTLGELTFRSRPSNRLEWLVGGFFSTSETSSDTLLSAIRPVPADVYGELRDDGLEEAALFGEASYDLTPKLTLTAGGRLYIFDYDTRSDVVLGDGNRRFRGRSRTGGFSPKLVLDYRPDDHVSVYALISQGHRVGGFNTAGPLSQMFTGGAASPTRDYEGDTLWNYEVGAKALLWEGRVQTRIATFVADWRNIQSDQFLPSGLAYAVNVGDGANRGIELETNWKASETFEVRANALLANPRITRPSDSFNSRGDAGLPGVPAVSANMTMAWRRSVGWGLDGFVNGTLAYVGASRLTFDAERRYRMGDYVTGRVSTGLEAKDWAVVAFVENPLNITANTFSFGDPFRLPEALATTPLRPRTIGVSLRLSR